MNASEIIDAIGGVAETARISGATEGGVRNWRRDGIPAKYWIPILDVARRRKLTGVTRESVAWRPRKARA